MSKLKFGVIIALIAGPFFVVTNYIETSEKKLIAREGIKTLAIPTSKTAHRGRRGSRTYKLEIKYPDQGGRTQTASVRVSHELFDKVNSNPMLEIKYLKNDPKKLIVVGEPLDSPEMYFAGIAAFLFGLGGTWWCFIRKKPESEPVDSPNPAHASPLAAASSLGTKPPPLPAEQVAVPLRPDNDDRFKPPGERK